MQDAEPPRLPPPLNYRTAGPPPPKGYPWRAAAKVVAITLLVMLGVVVLLVGVVFGACKLLR